MSGGWRHAIEPMDMRILNGFPIQFEATLVLRSTHAIVSNEISDIYRENFSTDEYRALLPIFTASIFTLVTSSYFLGSLFSDIFWWWMAAIATYALSRRLGHQTVSAAAAGILVSSSPLAVAQIGSGHLHAASSLALPIPMLIVWDAMFTTRSHIFSISCISFSILISSLLYTYQWVIIPWTIFIALTQRNLRIMLFRSILGCVLYFALSFFLQVFLSVGGLSLHANQNDPLLVLQSRLGPHIYSLKDSKTLVLFLENSIIVSYNTVIHICSVYSPFIFFLSLFGLLTRNILHVSWYMFSLVFSIAQGAITDLPWVIMSGFPIIYISAGAAIIVLVSRLFKLFCDMQHSRTALNYSFLIYQYVLFTLILIFCVYITNPDLLDDYSFVRSWFSMGYKPH